MRAFDKIADGLRDLIRGERKPARVFIPSKELAAGY
jgi:hypothetical protein